MKKILISSMVLLVIVFSFLYFNKDDISCNDEEIKHVQILKYELEYKENMDRCIKFVQNKLMSDDGGIYTNYLDNSNIDVLPSGHEILSESQGLLMMYYALIGDKKKYDRLLKYLDENMKLENNLYSWRYIENKNKITEVSATIDDIRIAKSLLYACNKWSGNKYTKILRSLMDSLELCTKKGYLCNFYDNEYEISDDYIKLCYVDFFTINKFIKHNSYWKDIYINSLKIVQEGYISDDFPMYKKSYSIKEGKYEDDTINSIDTMLVILHLCQIGMQKEESIQWIYQQILENGRVFNGYNKNGEVVDSSESASVYAIIAQIAKQLDDKELYYEALKCMLRFQVTDPKSEIYGSFGEQDTLKVYSFDNLQALLAF